MRLGLQIPSFRWPGGSKEIRPRLAGIARAAEEAGFSSLWVMDHFFQIEMVGPATDPMLECYTTLGFLAGVTDHVRLGALVTGAIYREPALLVKAATTLDVLSRGRACFGIGAGWYEREARGLGFPFPPIAERFERLEETLRIAKQMWSGAAGPFEGKHFRLGETLCEPPPISRPHPPILIGGVGEKKTLRLVARYADACNLFLFAGLDGIARKLEVLKAHCVAEGRDYDSIERTSLGTIHIAPGKDTTESAIETCRGLAAIGIQNAIFNLPNVHEPGVIETFEQEILPAVAGF